MFSILSSHRFSFWLFLAIILTILVQPGLVQAGPFVISKVTITTPTDNSVTISWLTSLESDGRIDYGPTTAYGFYIASSDTSSLYHEITLGNLQPDALYHFKITSNTTVGERIESFDQTFKTVKKKDTTVPVITDIRNPYTGGTYFIVTWVTDELSDSVVEYSTDGIRKDDGSFKKGVRASGVSNTKTHEVIVKGLKPNTLYYYQPRSRDKDRNEALYWGHMVTTGPTDEGDKALLNITQVSPAGPMDPMIGQNSVTFRWRTNKPSLGSVNLVSKKKGSKSGKEVGFNTIEHQIIVEKLSENTSYEVKITVRDIFGKSYTTSGFTIITAPPPIPELNTLTSTPDVNQPCVVGAAYGVTCRDVKTEQTSGNQLKQYVGQVFRGRTPRSAQRNWSVLMRAYVYGGYPAKAIVQAIKFGGKTVHPSIPWEKWKESADYKAYINR